MQYLRMPNLLLATVAAALFVTADAADQGKRRHRQHSHATAVQEVLSWRDQNRTREAHELLVKIRRVVKALDKDRAISKPSRVRGKIMVNAPIPPDFAKLFVEGAADATRSDPSTINFVGSSVLADTDDSGGHLAEVDFHAPNDVARALEVQAEDPDSKLAAGSLCPFLVARDKDGGIGGQCGAISALASVRHSKDYSVHVSQAQSNTIRGRLGQGSAPAGTPKNVSTSNSVPNNERENLDVDVQMPYGDLEPFGREDTAQELTESSIRESDAMVDQLERAEVAEEKRAVFRALTRLRGAAITSFDGIVRAQTANIDGYAKTNKWREGHPVRHLAQQESDVAKWAFPDF